MRTKFKNKIPLCACGCGKLVERNKWRDKWNLFINGHNRKGRKRSDETKLKIKQSNKTTYKNPKTLLKFYGKNNPFYGKKHSIKTKLKISKTSKGRKHSIESKLKMKGRKLSDETKLKMSISRSGKNHPMWKGGISCEPYCIDWTKEYKEYIRERDNNECQNPDCWHTSDHLPLTVHHIDYIKKNCIPRNLITLCNSCNSRANTDRKKWMVFYQEIIERKYLLKEVI